MPYKNKADKTTYNREYARKLRDVADLRSEKLSNETETKI